MNFKKYRHEEDVLKFIDQNMHLKGLFSIGPGAVIVNPEKFLTAQKNIIKSKPSQRQYDISIYHVRQFKQSLIEKELNNATN